MPPTIEAGQVFKAIESAIPLEVIQDTIAKSQCQNQRQRKLPAHLVVCLVIAFSFWSKAALRDVLKHLEPIRKVTKAPFNRYPMVQPRYKWLFWSYGYKQT